MTIYSQYVIPSTDSDGPSLYIEKELRVAIQVNIRCTRGGYKFVVLQNEKGEHVVFADDDRRYGFHRDLLAQYQKESGLQAECIGGGRISFDEEEKAIKIWGCSGDFGREPDRKETVQVLQGAYPDFDVTAGRT